jgi:hypothetical protein
MEERLTGELPLFVTVTVCVALVVPAVCAGKVRADGDRVKGAFAIVTVSAMVRVVFAMFARTVNV